MKILQGKAVCPGLYAGLLICYTPNNIKIARQTIAAEAVPAELAKAHAAIKLTLEGLTTLYANAKQRLGEEKAAIFATHQQMLEDQDFQETIDNYITTEKFTAAYAVQEAGAKFAEMLSVMEDSYMQARATDVLDITLQVLTALHPPTNALPELHHPYGLWAEDLKPSELMQLDKKYLAALVTSQGSKNSHTAILAKGLGIPTIVSVGGLPDGFTAQIPAIVDGNKGLVYLEPDDATKKLFVKKIAAEQKNKALLAKLKGQPTITQTGEKVKLYANIGSPADLPLVESNDAEGIGLYRSEFLYLERNSFPEEEELFAAYKEVVAAMRGKEVVIRTLDIGADKKADYFHLPVEENPALGYRAIRICLSEPEIFKTQLRAILRASAFGKAAIMFPMITSVQEVMEIHTIVDQVKAELRHENIVFDEKISLGIMVETPAAALCSEELGKIVDFFSIGTNDLTQYTLALDRQSTHLEKFYNAHHPAVLKLIALTAENARKNGIWCGICGELGADLTLTEEFLKMGIDELSVSPSKILPVREKIRSL